MPAGGCQPPLRYPEVAKRTTGLKMRADEAWTRDLRRDRPEVGLAFFKPIALRSLRAMRNRCFRRGYRCRCGCSSRTFHVSGQGNVDKHDLADQGDVVAEPKQPGVGIAH